jgi:hypothetical protein
MHEIADKIEITDIVERLRNPHLQEYVVTPLECEQEIESLRQQLAEQPLSFGHWKEVFEASINELKKQLAEGQAREMVLRDAASEADEQLRWFLQEANNRGSEGPPRVWRLVNRMQALAMPSDSTALNTMLEAAELKGRREALLEMMVVYNQMAISGVAYSFYDKLVSKAKELE